MSKIMEEIINEEKIEAANRMQETLALGCPAFVIWKPLSGICMSYKVRVINLTKGDFMKFSFIGTIQ